jgi:hypothetical protein
MRGRSKVLTVGVALPAVALVAQAPGCRTATQVTLDIETNVVCADMRGVDIVIAPDSHEAEHRAALDVPGTRFATATSTACAEGAAPRQVGTLVVTPGGGNGAVVVVAAFGNTTTNDCLAPTFAPGCIVARRRFSFVDHQAVTLPIVLDPICAGIPCNENSTCVGKKCVDSQVECTSGTCGDPGQRSADGGLVEVDASSPLDASGGADASEAGGMDAAADGASDGSISDGATDAPLEGSADAGSGSCPLSSICAAPSALVCVSPVGGTAASMCCYATDPPTCGAQGGCAAISGCCRSADDCPNAGDVCCASTATPTSSTTIVCKPPVACAKALGTAVCATPGNTGCAGRTCIGAVYSTAPDYYACS